MFDLAFAWSNWTHAGTRYACSNRPTGDGEAASRDASPSINALCAEAPRLRRLVHRLLGMRSASNDLDDIVQDVLLAAIRGRSGFRGDAKLSTWLTRIALRKAHNHARATRLRERVFALFGQQPETAEPTEQPQDERWVELQSAMRDLPHRDRETLVLRYLEQRDVVEIATLLGCSREAVDARLSRARKRLRTQLGGKP